MPEVVKRLRPTVGEVRSHEEDIKSAAPAIAITVRLAAQGGDCQLLERLGGICKRPRATRQDQMIARRYQAAPVAKTRKTSRYERRRNHAQESDQDGMAQYARHGYPPRFAQIHA